MSIKRYRIVVTEIGEETRTVERRWEMGGDGDPNNYGYTPEIEAMQQYSRDVYEQQITDLNLPKLIAAVNNLTPTE